MSSYVNPLPSLDDEELNLDGVIDIAEDYQPMPSVYFAFIDILGFKKTFDDNRDKEGNEFADKYKNVFNYYFELMDSADFMNKSAECYVGQTSDSLYFYTLRSDLLIEFIKLFSAFNLYAMMNDVFFRGGIAKGKLFCKEKYQFYGDSVIYAYLLESVIAKNPVIFIDENTYQDIKGYKECENLISNKNGRHYIRPFAPLQQKVSLDSGTKDCIREIDNDVLLAIIEGNKKIFEYDGKNYEKYVFLLNEYNEIKNI